MEEAVEEALCFGWIDSRMHPIDADTYRVVFSPRRPGSIWSANNKRRIERLIRDGLMTEAGLATIERAKADGMWTSLDGVEALEIPEDLSSALDAAPSARANFDAYPASTRKLVLHHVNGARRPATRARRIADLVRLAEENRRPFQVE